MSVHRYGAKKLFKHVAVDVLDEEEIPIRVDGFVHIADDGTVEWSGEVKIFHRECLDDWSEANSGNLSSRDLITGRLLMMPLEKSCRRLYEDDGDYILKTLFEPPERGGIDVTDNFAVLKEAYDKVGVRSPDFDERVRRLRERQGR